MSSVSRRQGIMLSNRYEQGTISVEQSPEESRPAWRRVKSNPRSGGRGLFLRGTMGEAMFKSVRLHLLFPYYVSHSQRFQSDFLPYQPPMIMPPTDPLSADSPSTNSSSPAASPPLFRSAVRRFAICQLLLTGRLPSPVLIRLVR